MTMSDAGAARTKAKREPWAGSTTEHVPIARLHVWAGNPRRYHKRLRELGDAMRRDGQLDPIIVRRSTAHPGDYDIADGTRRRQAAQLVGIPELRVEVRELTDREMVDVALAANGDREDFHPLEEAEGYRLLFAEHGVAVAEIAAKHGVTQARVHGRLQLCQLAPAVREAFEQERMGVGAALQLARLAPAVQEKVFGALWRPTTAVQISELEVRGYLRRTVFLRLADAPFPLKQKVPGASAPACEECPKRTTNQRQLFEQSEELEDSCTDPACWMAKRDAHVVKLRERHARTFEQDKAKSLFAPGHAAELSHASGYVEVDRPSPALAGVDGKPRAITKLCGEGSRTVAVLAIDPHGNPRLLVTTEQARSLLRESGHVELAKKMQGPSAEQRAELARKEEARAAAASAKDHKERVARAMGVLSDAAAATLTFPKGFWQWLVLAFVRHASHETIVHVHKRLVVATGEQRGKLGRQDMERAILNARDIGEGPARGLAIELAASRAAYNGTAAEGAQDLLRGACEVFGVDLDRAMVGAPPAKKKKVEQPAKKKAAKKAAKKGKVKR